MTEQAESAALTKLILHVRFSPDGAVKEIQDRPPELGAQQWFDRLSNVPNVTFETLSGGRGVFRLTAAEIESAKPAAASQ